MVEHLRLASDRDSLDASEPEDDGLCPRCGHAVDMHRTKDMRCTAEVPNLAESCPLCDGHIIAGWLESDEPRCAGCGVRLATLRCGCDIYPRVVWNESRSNGGQDD